MPTYVYEAKDAAKSCNRCRGSFEAVQKIGEPALSKCPECGADVIRVIQAASLGRSKTDLMYRAKRAGFSCLKKVSNGEYEKAF
ncbi:MAG: zinc ribbon domain-containing protein [Kiritimatiellae bacterium]|nr:zinc ribbon domain-containing protein [Kiritimatiellia bacterium]